MTVALASLFFAAVLLWGKEIVAHKKSFALTGFMVAAAMAFLIMGLGRYQADVKELDLEAQKQREMIAVAEFFKAQIPPGRGDRIMMPSRRNEQLSWLFRDREILDVVALREAFYLKTFKGIDFLELHPDWIVYIPGDFHFWGTPSMFDWLGVQDLTVLHDVEIRLIMNTELVRVFKVTYPPGHPEKGPLPPMP